MNYTGTAFAPSTSLRVLRVSLGSSSPRWVSKRLKRHLAQIRGFAPPPSFLLFVSQKSVLRTGGLEGLAGSFLVPRSCFILGEVNRLGCQGVEEDAKCEGIESRAVTPADEREFGQVDGSASAARSAYASLRSLASPRSEPRAEPRSHPDPARTPSAHAALINSRSIEKKGDPHYSTDTTCSQDEGIEKLLNLVSSASVGLSDPISSSVPHPGQHLFFRTAKSHRHFGHW